MASHLWLRAIIVPSGGQPGPSGSWLQVSLCTSVRDVGEKGRQLGQRAGVLSSQRPGSRWSSASSCCSRFWAHNLVDSETLACPADAHCLGPSWWSPSPTLAPDTAASCPPPPQPARLCCVTLRPSQQDGPLWGPQCPICSGSTVPPQEAPVGVRISHKEKHGGEGGAGQDAPACTLSGHASAQAMPPPKVPAAPTHLGFPPPPGSLLGCPPAQPASTLSSFGLPRAPTTVNSLGCGVQPGPQEISDD